MQTKHSCKKFALKAELFSLNSSLKHFDQHIDELSIKLKEPNIYIEKIIMTLTYIQFFYSLTYMISYKKLWTDKPTCAIYSNLQNHFCSPPPKEKPIDLSIYITDLKEEWINKYGY